MKILNAFNRSVFAVVVAAATICWVDKAQAQTDTISINWKEFAGSVNDVIDPYGVVEANNWQNLLQIDSANDIVTSSGATSTVDFSTTVPGGWGTFFGGGPLDNTPMRAGIESFSSTNGPDLTLSDLNGTFISYDLIVYVSGFNGAGNQGSITDGSSTLYYSVPNPYTGSLIESTDTNISDGADVGNYVRFDGLTADSVTLSLRSPNSTGVAIGGIQITGTAVPEPSSAAIALLGGGLLALIRRRR